MLYQDLLKARDVENWEEAATKTVAALFSYIKNYSDMYDINELHLFENKLSNNDLTNMKNIINLMIDNKIWESDPVYSKTSDADVKRKNEIYHLKHWATLSLISVAMLRKIKNFEYSEYSFFVKKTVIAKQKDYGPNNISRFGINGLVIRMHDKIARLENLISKNNLPQNESILDTLLDIIGYSIVAIMWINGTFLFPLSNEDNEIKKHKIVINGKPINLSTESITIGNGKINSTHPNIKFR